MHSLKELSDQLETFAKDRPVMAVHNAGEEHDRGKSLAKLLAAEGIEFEERQKINKGEIEIDLLALYEIADIIIFSITLLQVLGRDPNDMIYEFEPEDSQLQMLRKIGDATSKISMWAEDGLKAEIILQDVKDAAMYSIALMQSLGIDPMLTCFEKLGHNMARYPANRFQEGHDYDTERKKCKRVAKSYLLEDSFYSPLDPDSPNPIYRIRS